MHFFVFCCYSQCIKSKQPFSRVCLLDSADSESEMIAMTTRACGTRAGHRDCLVNWDSGLSAFSFICHLYVSALMKMSCGCVSQYQLREEPTLFVTTSTSLARFHTLHVWMEFVFVSTASCLPMILPAVRFYMTLTRVHFIPSRYQRICTQQLPKVYSYQESRIYAFQLSRVYELSNVPNIKVYSTTYQTITGLQQPNVKGLYLPAIKFIHASYRGVRRLTINGSLC